MEGFLSVSPLVLRIRLIYRQTLLSLRIEQPYSSGQIVEDVQPPKQRYQHHQAVVNILDGKLRRMEVRDFIANEEKKEDLEKVYGLEKSALTATVSFTTKDKKPQPLEIGKQRGDKPGFFAKLASSPAVFV